VWSVWRTYEDPARLLIEPEVRSITLGHPCWQQRHSRAFGGEIFMHQAHRCRAVTDGKATGRVGPHGLDGQAGGSWSDAAVYGTRRW
jgi:hypothetical protein